MKNRVGRSLGVTCVMLVALFLLNGTTVNGQSCTLCHTQFKDCVVSAWTGLLQCETNYGRTAVVSELVSSCQGYVDSLTGSPGDEANAASLRTCVDRIYTEIFGVTGGSIPVTCGVDTLNSIVYSSILKN